MNGNKPDEKIYSSTKQGKYTVRITDSLYMNEEYNDSLFKWILDSPLSERGKYVYSDLGPILMKELVEKVTGKKMDEYLQENFYRPLGLTRMTFLPKDKFSVNEIIPTENDT